MVEIEGYLGFRRIGEGGAGVVYRAVCRATGGQVAVKMVRDVSDRSAAQQHMRRELAALVALGGHANVVQLIETIEHQGGPALVMEYASGGSVADLMARRDGVLTVGEAALIGTHTARALVAAHAAGIVHRDIKPHNLVIDGSGQVKLCDFGIASLIGNEEFGDRTDAWSARYASPEDLDGDRPVGPASDVYSLGATLLHLAHGAPPTLRDRLSPWIAADTDDPQLAAFDQVLAACLHTDPAARPTAVELLERLEAVGAMDRVCARALVGDVVVEPALTPAASDDGDRCVDRLDQAPGDPFAGPYSELAGWWALDDRTSATDDDDVTIRRPGRPAVVTPIVTPIVTEGRRRRSPVVAGVLATALVVACGAALIRRDDDARRSAPVVATDPSPPGSSLPDAAGRVVATSTTAVLAPATLAAGALQIVERPSGMTAIDDLALEWPFGAVGECLVQRPDRAVLDVVACGRPHDLQRYAVGDLGDGFAPNADFDATSVEAVVADRCAAAFDAVVVSHPVIERLDRPVTLPSAATFEAGDRRFQCLVGVYGQRLVGDVTVAGS